MRSSSTVTSPDSSHSSLRGGVEFDLVRRMVDRWGKAATGIGDDAAIIVRDKPGTLVMSTDVSVENVHFRRDWLTPTEIGYRATAAALSDLAAMGAQPLGILVALSIPDSWRDSIDAISDGIGEAVVGSSTFILGGDLSEARDLSLAITVIGSAVRPLRRNGASSGDRVFVTGTLGGPFASLASWNEHAAPSADHRARFAHPVPRFREAVWLAEKGASSATDVSDGLASDLSNIAAASEVSISISLDRLPIMQGVTARDAAGSGEEYELVVTSPTGFDTAAFESEFGIPLTEIGAVETGRPIVRVFDRGAPVPTPSGYLHFTS